MVEVALAVGAIALAVAALWIIKSPGRPNEPDQDKCWRMAGEALGLEYDEGGATAGPTLEGELAGFPLLVDTFGRSDGTRRRTFTRVVIDAGERMPDNIDGTVVPNPQADALTRLLDQTSRRRISDLVKTLGATVGQGKVRWAREGLVWPVVDFVQTVRTVVRTTEHLCVDESDIPGRLLLASRDHELPDEQRKQLLLVLFDRFPGTPEAIAGARDGLSHPEPEVRIEAARALGRTGVPALGQFARDPGLEQELRVVALTALVDEHGPELHGPQLRKVLQAPEPEVCRTAVHFVRRTDLKTAVPFLLELATDPRTSNDLLTLLVETIGEMGDVSAEPTLMGLLHHADMVVRRGAAVALGRIGGPGALEPLYEQVEVLGADARLRSTCLAAMREIRARFGLPEKDLL